MKKNLSLGTAVLGLVLPVAVWSQVNPSSFLTQVPNPPSTFASAQARYQATGDPDGPCDSKSIKLNAKIDEQQKALGDSSMKVGGESAQDMQAKMANMTQDEKIAYAMKLSSQMQQDQQAAYSGANGQAMIQSSQNDMAAGSMNSAQAKGSQTMMKMDNDYKAQFDALMTNLIAAVQACPKTTTGEATVHSPDCTAPLLAKYKADYQALALKEMASYATFFAGYKKDISAEVAAYQKDIDGLSGDSTDTASNAVARKKQMIYDDIRALTKPSEKMVRLGNDAATLDPQKACGSNCF